MNIELLIDLLKQGKLAIIPTDTTYGIICDATNIEAVKKVFVTKKRSSNKPLIILVSDINMLKEYTKDINSLETEIIEKYMPGPLSILLPKNNNIDDLVTASSPLVGIRIPNNQDLITLITKINKPIIATSANISGDDVITNANEINNELLKNIDYVDDGGTITSVASTIIKIENDKIKFLREGKLAETIKKDFKDKLL